MAQTEELTTPAAPGSANGVGAGANPGWRVRAVIPCFGRQADLDRLLGDLAASGAGSGPGEVSVCATVVDNASEPPLVVAAPPGLEVELIRLERNTGGSGGFSAGMERALATPASGGREVIWLLDSDVRLEPGALGPLVAALERDAGLAAVGSALADPQTGEVFEVGGRVSRRTGEFEQPLPPGWQGQEVVDAEYVAACSLLVRREAVERTGVMADLFLNGDDVEWCCRIRAVTGKRVGVATASRARHPRPDRMRTGARYYAARNASTAIAAALRASGERASRGLVFRRAMREVGRALAMTMMGRDDLSRLHVLGLRDAAAGARGAAPAGTVKFEPFEPLDRLPGRVRQIMAEGTRGRVMIRAGALADEAPLRRALHLACVDPVTPPPECRTGALGRAVWRLIAGPRCGVAVVRARGHPEDWLCARVMVTVCPEGFAVRRVSRAERLGRVVGVAARGAWWAAKAAMSAMPEVGARRVGAGRGAARERTATPTVSVVILSHNRKEALARTLGELERDPGLRGAEIIVADNASSDGTPEYIRRRFRDVRVIDMGQNRGVAGFNAGVARAGGDAVLILDDDSWPAEGVMEKALALLAERPEVGAVALHPRHPGTKESEWGWIADCGSGIADGRIADCGSGIADVKEGEGAPPTPIRNPQSAIRHPQSDIRNPTFPVMGCGNLVRREAWERVGGYEESFFLYRNDVDLALKLLAAGEGVWFDPSWVVWHDSPGAKRKSVRWFEGATRNWVWLCRRHGRGKWKWLGVLAGWAWAHRLAGWDVRRHWAAMWGAVEGLWMRPRELPGACARDGKAFEALMRARVAKGGRPRG